MSGCEISPFTYVAYVTLETKIAGLWHFTHTATRSMSLAFSTTGVFMVHLRRLLKVPQYTCKILHDFSYYKIVGAIVFIIPCSIAYFLNFNRMYIYAVLFTLSFALNEITIANTGVIASGAYAWLISAIILIVIGVVYLVRFLKKYPLPGKEVLDVIK
ncbi:MAG: hypothetical protein ISS94_00390 [Candidatus Syntrophoarchaeum sp.]|nr:hypothetical protein [Methanomicrobia archaeon]MBL7117233.1 hypothetical protein [Candidatus Syntrophoarchaeum sp.]